MGVRTGFGLQELGVVAVSFLDSLVYVVEILLLRVALHALPLQRVSFSRLATFGLLDIAEVRVASDCKPTQDKSKPTVPIVVKSIGLVPLGELPNILMSVVRQIAFLVLSGNSGVRARLTRGRRLFEGYLQMKSWCRCRSGDS